MGMKMDRLARPMPQAVAIARAQGGMRLALWLDVIAAALIFYIFT
jgi:hypothetical protein